MNLKMYMLSETMMGKDMASEKFGQNRAQNKSMVYSNMANTD